MTKRARPICDDLMEIKRIVQFIADDEGKILKEIIKLCDDALGKAKRMQARLQQNKADILKLALMGKK